MNLPPRQPTITNSRGHPREFAQVIAEKSQNFVGREFIFTAIREFIHRYQRGYFTIIGAPGSGKSAILAKYVTQNPDVIYYNAEVDDKNRPEEFLRNICTQLIDITPPQPSPQGRREEDLSGGQKAVPNNVTEGSWFLSLLLQQISDSLQPNQKLIIAIDGLHSVNRKLQPPGTNIFYLPRYLPDKVYFLLTRRPFVRENAGLLIETPSQILDLAAYPQENQQDIQAYIQTYLNPQEIPPTPLEKGGDIPPLLRGVRGDLLRGERGDLLREVRGYLKSWLNHLNINQQEFANYLTTTSENNFMYLSEIINAIVEGFYSETFPNNQLPPRLEIYYQQHLQKMISAQPSEEISGAVLKVLAQQTQPISAEKIAEILDTDEYEIEEILENWFEFLHHSPIGKEGKDNYYSLYHSSFRHWLASQGERG